MNFKTLSITGLCCVLGVGAGIYAYRNAPVAAIMDNIQAQAGDAAGIFSIPDRENLYGDYLNSQFAQQHHDWKLAGNYLDQVMLLTPDDTSVQKRAMILAMGAGDAERSLEFAKKVLEKEPNNSLALLFLAAGSLHSKNYQEATTYLKAVPPGSLSDFIMPLLNGWTQAGLGNFDANKLRGNVIHLHHAILIADYLGKKDEVEKLVVALTQAQNLTPTDIERIGDIYAHIGKMDKATETYNKALAEWPENATIPAKLAAIQNGQSFVTMETVKTPEDGVAMAIYNMAQLLYQEYADESARVFANVALYLDPTMTDANLLLAAITSRNERVSDAIEYYHSIKADNPYYIEAHRRAANLLEEAGRTDEALAELNGLVKDKNDLESLVQIGDIYRKQEDFKKAVATYNDAEKRLGGHVPKEYWSLLYARGMSLERLGEWDKAEADLKAALAYQPDHPYVLNYLAYAWTDQGVNLDQALAMIKKAAGLKPTDGYITDSLGWVYYRRGEFDQAVKPLETAVELLPYDPVVNDHLGDAYWKAGRKLEARFQWQRAKNYSKDAAFMDGMDRKLADGLTAATEEGIKQAHSSPPPDMPEQQPDVMKR